MNKEIKIDTIKKGKKSFAVIFIKWIAIYIKEIDKVIKKADLYM